MTPCFNQCVTKAAKPLQKRQEEINQKSGVPLRYTTHVFGFKVTATSRFKKLKSILNLITIQQNKSEVALHDYLICLGLADNKCVLQHRLCFVAVRKTIIDWCLYLGVACLLSSSPLLDHALVPKRGEKLNASDVSFLQKSQICSYTVILKLSNQVKT
jgi:hypothetical protein